ncbi:hypothetical protein EDB92DRAFT_52699 [Lactarius akahatsu]|uniref:Uncharacterized protein n=1 Tax=Lactarius akahatsu TaxID=416441 RepID=A0AAD4LUJ2_9AGAM|nr:hypothetical protein EDB92DRAFT_52699 [Lactarius akahatsu]
MASASTSTQAPAQAGKTGGTPLVAQGDWTKNLVQLAKTAELKKYALTLQLQTAHILSAHATLEQKMRSIQDLKEQTNKLDSERARLLNCLREVNEDRDKTDMMEAQLNNECTELRTRIQQITDGEYATAKRDVDALRAELGQPPLPSLQTTLEEKSQLYVRCRRRNELRSANAGPLGTTRYLQERRLGGEQHSKRTADEIVPEGAPASSTKRPRGRPKGSKNRGGKVPSGSGQAPEAVPA